MTGSASEVLWEVLTGAYRRLGFDTVADEAFRALVLARGSWSRPRSRPRSGSWRGSGCRRRTATAFTAALRPRRGQGAPPILAAACAAHSRRSGAASLVLDDVMTLHFEAETEDALREVGMSEERRVDPQIQVGLLVDPSGFPLEVSCFEGDTAETTTLLPVLRGFAEPPPGVGHGRGRRRRDVVGEESQRVAGREVLVQA